MLKSEEFVLDCLNRYSREGLTVNANNGEFAHYPKPECLGGTTGAYLLHGDHQLHGLLQSIDFGKCCFYPGHVKKWLLSYKEVLDDFEYLWEVYERYTSQHGAERAALIPLEDKRRGGLTAVQRKAGIHNPKNKDKVIENNRQNALKAVQSKTGIHDPSLRDKCLEAGARARAQIWESTVDGFKGNAGNVAKHNKAIGADPKARVRVS